jgi:ABC-type polysaccharide/polyol phosphate transport system ATPase subunit/SAM-dependent methyltransferase
VSARPVVVAEGLSKRFALQTERALTVKEGVIDRMARRGRAQSSHFDALKSLSFSVAEGESVALIGRNGSGKSTLLKVIAGIHHATGGRLRVRARLRMATMIELGVGFHPELTGRENVYLNAAIHGLSREQIDAIYPRVVDYAELERFIDTPIKTYSSGMVMRLGFATGISLDPDVFLLDEIFAVGDEAFQQKCLNSMRTFRNAGKTMFFVSHSADAVREMCTRALVLDHGQLVFDGNPEAAIRRYRRILGEEPSLGGADHFEQLPEEARSAIGRETGWHRRVVGGDTWEAAGERHFTFLREQGLQPSDHVLDLGCGCLRTGVYLLRFLHEGHYVGVDHNTAIIEAGVKIEAPQAGVDPTRGHYYVADVADLSKVQGQFDVIWSVGLAQSLTVEQIARMFAGAISRLASRGRMYLAFFEAPTAASLDPIERPGPSYSYFDQLMRHFDYETLARLARACGGSSQRIGEWGDPHGQTMMVVTRNSEA